MTIMEFTHFEVVDFCDDTKFRLPLSARPTDPLTICNTARDCLTILQALEVVRPFEFIRMGSVMVTAMAERREVAA